MKKPRAMRNITRVDYERRRQHGWWVRVTRDGEQYQKFFSDSANGGKFSARRAAIEHRNYLLKRYPKPEHGNMFNRASSRNTSGGYPGVHKSRDTKQGRIYEVWVAGWTLPGGRSITRKYHFSPDGRSVAYETMPQADRPFRGSVLIKSLDSASAPQVVAGDAGAIPYREFC